MHRRIGGVEHLKSGGVGFDGQDLTVEVGKLREQDAGQTDVGASVYDCGGAVLRQPRAQVGDVVEVRLTEELHGKLTEQLGICFNYFSGC